MRDLIFQGRIKVVSDLRGLRSPIDFSRTVDCLLCGVPGMYLAGLDTIVLRDSGGLTSNEKKKRYRRPGKVLLGTYYHATRKAAPQIHLFVDKITEGWPTWLLRVPLIREVLLAVPLFHEIGHHIQAKIVPKHGDHEDTAEGWSKRLTGEFLSQRYRYLIPIFRRLGKVAKWIKRRRKRVEGRENPADRLASGSQE
jgi:hypothetical protein